MFAIGGIYKEDLKDFDYAIKSYEDLLKRYQQFELEPATFYALYLLYNNKSMAMQSENYKQQVLKNYPNSEFAKLLSNPNYLEEKKQEPIKLKHIINLPMHCSSNRNIQM